MSAPHPIAKPAGATPSVSFEFFPPRNEAGTLRLEETARRLSRLSPDYVSVTCGAGGSAIDGTTAVVNHIRSAFGLEVAPHVAIARQRRSRLRQVLREYKESGVRRIVAIRGDESQSSEVIPSTDLFPDTVAFVTELRRDFELDPVVAAYPDTHPRAASPQHDLDYLRRKADAGAALAISQFFFLPESFLRFRDKVRAVGIKLPIAPGVMPIQNFAQVAKFANGCGAKVPAGFGRRFEKLGNDERALFQEGVAHAAELCDQLRREGVDHFHFYTLNRWEMSEAVCEKLGFRGQDSGVTKASLNPEPRSLNPIT